MEIENIVNLEGLEEFVDLVKCKICFMISLKPVACKQCESVFCRDCLNTWVKKHNTCPLRCKNFSINEEPRLVKNILSKFFYNCKNCKNKICLNDFDHHSQTCSESKINCPDCNMLIRKTFLPTHIKHFCENTTVQCDLCKSLVKRKNLGSSDSEINPASSFYLKRIKELEKELLKKDEMIEGLQMSIQNLTKREAERQVKIKEGSSNNIVMDIEIKEQINYENNFIYIKGEIEKELLKVDIQSLITNTNNLLIVNNIDYLEGSMMVFGITNGIILIYSIQTKIFTKIQGHSNNILKLKLYYLNQTKKVVLYSISLDQTMTIWDINNFSSIKTIKFPYLLTCACFLENDFLVTADTKGFLHLYDLSILEEVLSSNITKDKINNIKFINRKKNICCTTDNRVLLVDIYSLNKTNESRIILDSKYSDIEYSEIYDTLFFITEKGVIYSVPYDLNNKKIEKLIELKIQSKHQLNIIDINESSIMYVFSPFNQLEIFSVNSFEGKFDLFKIYSLPDKNLNSFNCHITSSLNSFGVENEQKDSITFLFTYKYGIVSKGEMKINKK